MQSLQFINNPFISNELWCSLLPDNYGHVLWYVIQEQKRHAECTLTANRCKERSELFLSHTSSSLEISLWCL